MSALEIRRLNRPPSRHFGRSPTVLVPSAHSTMSVWIGYILARIGHELVDGWKIGILLTKVAVDRHLSVV